MPSLTPFRATRYTAEAGDAADLLAPPYDVIGPGEAAALRARSPHNAVRLVLPERPGAEGHRAAAGLLLRWLEAGTLREDAERAAYAYRQSFVLGGEIRERRALVAALELSPPGRGEVLPHEETHAAPREDRIGLTLACEAQLSPVFLVAGDADGALARGLAAAEGAGEAVLQAETPDGIGHRLVRLPEGPSGELCGTAGARPLLIADGHHRYETALAVSARLESARARRVLACVVSEADPGLLVFPTHRALAADPPAGGWEAALEEAFELEALEPRADGRDAAAEAARRAARAGGGYLALADRATGRFWLLRPRELAAGADGAGAAAGPDAHDAGATDGPGAAAEARIASVPFDRLVLRRLHGLSAEEASERRILSYHRDAGDAWEAAGPGGAAWLLSPPRAEDVRAVAAAGRRLPPKTTYFAPKVPSGLLFRRLSVA